MNAKIMKLRKTENLIYIKYITNILKMYKICDTILIVKEVKMKDTIIFKVSYELKEQLQKEAKERDMSLSSYIKSIIAERKK